MMDRNAGNSAAPNDAPSVFYHSGPTNTADLANCSQSELWGHLREQFELILDLPPDSKIESLDNLKDVTSLLFGGMVHALERDDASASLMKDLDATFVDATTVAVDIAGLRKPGTTSGSIEWQQERVTQLLSLALLLRARIATINLNLQDTLEQSSHEQLLLLRDPHLTSTQLKGYQYLNLSEAATYPAALRSGLTLSSARSTQDDYAATESIRLESLQQCVMALIADKLPSQKEGIISGTIISLARTWNALDSSVAMDRTAAHALLLLLPPLGPLRTLTSSAFTAIVPIAMRLLERYHADLHSLGLVLLLRAADATPSGLLATFQEWILPHVFTYIEIVDDDWSRLLAARVVQALLACDLNSSVALQHAHLYLEVSTKLLAMKPTAGFAWPCLLHLNLSLAWLPDGVVGTHLRALLDCYLQLLSVWHVSLQDHVLRGLYILRRHVKAADCAEDYIPLVTTELVRFLVFYQHSGHRDLSDADPESVTALVANAVTTAQAWRELNETAWESHLRSLDRGRTVQTNAHSEERAAVNRQPKEQVREEAIDAVGAAIATLLTT